MAKKKVAAATPESSEASEASEAEVSEAEALPRETVVTGGGAVQDRLTALLKSASMKALAKKHPTAPVATTTAASLRVPRFRTGIIGLDLAFRGGLPAGIVHHWFGNKASGKTTALLLVIAAMQHTCAACYRALALPGQTPCCDRPRPPVCAFVNVESPIDGEWAKDLGVDFASLLYSHCATAEQGIDSMDALLSSEEVDFLAFDSIGAMIPTSELNKTAEEVDVGTVPRMVHRFTRKMTSGLNTQGQKYNRRPTVVLLNQTRMKVGVMFGNPETTSGGMGPGFHAGAELRFSPAKVQRDDKTNQNLYVEISPTVNKSKYTNTTGTAFSFRVAQNDGESHRKGQILDAGPLVDLGVQAGIIAGAGPSWTCLGEPFRGKSLIEDKIAHDPGLRARVYDSILQVMLAA